MALNYDAGQAPTCAKFMRSEAFGRLIAGPVGSGKTTACLIELLRRAIEQGPGEDGLSHTRFAITRQTLKQLKDTVLKDCKEWLAGMSEYRVSENTLYVNFQRVRSEWVFIPLEDAEDQARLLSMQLTGAWLSEAIEMDIGVLAPISGRIGRYPSGANGAPTWYGMIADTNMPSEGSAWEKFMKNPPPDWDIHIQPSGLDARAENLSYLLQTEASKKLPLADAKRIALGRRYYERLVEMYGIDSDWVKRYVKAEYGDDPSGSAVFRASFTYNFHCVEDTTPIPAFPLIVGQDFGRDPWSVICQVDHLGRLVVHEEVPGTMSGKAPDGDKNLEGIGLEGHITRNLRPRLLQPQYHGLKIAVVGDPAGRAKSSITEENSIDVLKRNGFAAFPAPTNDLDPRLRAVEAFLQQQVSGGPKLMINKHKCPTLVRAFNGGYKFGRNKAGQPKPKPDKNPYSHVMDAMEYAALVAHGGMLQFIVGQITPRARQNRQKITAAGWT
jgi:hypothetical protein